MDNVEKIEKFYHDIIGLKSEAVVQKLAENSQICKLKAKSLLIEENDKVEDISFLYKTGGVVKAYYRNGKGKNKIHCFAHLQGEPVVGILNLGRSMNSLLTVEAVTDCEIIRTSANAIYELSRESVEVALVCNRMQSVSAAQEYEYRKMILNCTPVQKFDYFQKVYPEILKVVNKKDVASYLNITPECLSRVLKTKRVMQ